MLKGEQFYNKNQFLINNDGTIFLLSYGKTVAKLTPWGELTFGKDWDYSKTTLKHIYLFLTEYVVAYLGHYIGEGWHFLTQHFDINKWIYGKNKRAFLQNLIDKKVIDYKADL